MIKHWTVFALVYLGLAAIAFGQYERIDPKAFDVNKATPEDTITYYLYGDFYAKIIMDKRHRVAQILVEGDTTGLKRSTKKGLRGETEIFFVDSLGNKQGPYVRLSRRNRLLNLFGFKQNLMHGYYYGYYRKTQRIRYFLMYLLEIPQNIRVLYEKGNVYFDVYGTYDPNRLMRVE
jgi:hypothetical protein